ncbi:MAG: HNH endonuclease, partial [Acidobacteriota bacterium]
MEEPLVLDPAVRKAQMELEKLGDEIAELSAHIEAATYRFLTLIRKFDQRSGWNNGACRSCAHWLNWRIGLDLGAARQKVR